MDKYLKLQLTLVGVADQHDLLVIKKSELKGMFDIQVTSLQYYGIFRPIYISSYYTFSFHDHFIVITFI